jgi:ferritin-like metal-binding protein YciE
MKNTTTKTLKEQPLKKQETDNTQQKNPITKNLQKLFLSDLKHIYWAEKALAKALPKMIKKADSDTLVAVLTHHAKGNKGHLTQLKTVFSTIGKKAKTQKCDTMSDLIKEIESKVKKSDKGVHQDTNIIVTVQKMTYYEILKYSALYALAKNLEENAAADLLHETLEQEHEADAKLLDFTLTFFKTHKTVKKEKTQLEEVDTQIDVVHPYLVEANIRQVKSIRIVDIQYKEGDNLRLSTESGQTLPPLSININLSALQV